MKTVYVAGKYRGANAWEIEQNIRAAEEAGLEIAPNLILTLEALRRAKGNLTDG